MYDFPYIRYREHSILRDRKWKTFPGAEQGKETFKTGIGLPFCNVDVFGNWLYNSVGACTLN